MPLVLTQNEATESGHEYADVLGQSYEYPLRYRNQIRTGEQFVYYRGRRTSAGGVQPQVYLGTAVIGEISHPSADGRLTCKVEDFRPFPTPLSFKDGDEYREVGARAYDQARAGLYFRTGVRVIDQANFEAIVEAGWDGVRLSEVTPPVVTSTEYASPELVRLVDEIAMDLAVDTATRRWPSATVRRMPHHNPGFDLRIERSGQADEYVEVKGTTRTTPVFFLTEGERVFAEAHASLHHLWVFYGIDVHTRSGEIEEHAGALVEPDVRLEPVQWIGILKAGFSS